MTKPIFHKEDEWFMSKAITQANQAFKAGEVPVGALVVDANQSILAESYNLKEKNFDTTAQEESLAIKEASKKLSNWRLSECTLYVTLEPCPMCLFAALQARLTRVVFGAYDAKAGSISLGYQFYRDERFNHRFDVVGGVLHYSCSQLISDFFRLRRKKL